MANNHMPTAIVSIPKSPVKTKTKTVPTWKENVSRYFSQYCAATCVHGVQYLGDRGRYAFERLIWTVILTMVGYFCTILILNAYYKWTTSPVIVTIANTETRISEIPFPAVTICPEVQYDPGIFNYTDVLIKKMFKRDLDESEEKYFQSFSLICHGLEDFIFDLGALEAGSLTVDKNVVNYLAKAFPRDNEYNISRIAWLQHEEDFKAVTTETLTSSGICYSFNMLSPEDIFQHTDGDAGNIPSGKQLKQWSLENGYPQKSMVDDFPRRTFLAGLTGGLTSFLVTNHSHLDYVCGDALQGFKIALHLPSELPNMDRHFRLPLDETVLVAIKPRMITVSPKLIAYAPEDRKCYFSHERSLAFYKSYTQQNCLAECFANYSLRHCGCISFHLPTLKGHNSPTCGSGSKSCLESAKVNYLLHDDKICNCLSPCTSLEYDVEISQTDWNWKRMMDVFHDAYGQYMDVDYNRIHLSLLAVYYKEMQFFTLERNELYGITDFWSHVGGLLSLFIGFSVTSLIEKFYFATLRVACNVIRHGKLVWSGDKELIGRLIEN